MVDLGIVELVPDPADGRAKLVRYTDAGRAQTHLGFRHIRRFEQRLTDELGDDYEAARRVLERVVAILESDDADAAVAPGTSSPRNEAESARFAPETRPSRRSIAPGNAAESA